MVEQNNCDACKESENSARKIVNRLISDIYQVADDVIGSSISKDDLDCKMGCAYCCYAPVAISGGEALQIADGIIQNYSETEVKEFVKKVAEKLRLVQDLTWIEYARAKIPCTFLGKKNICLIYEDRPVICRSWTSNSSRSCKDALRNDITMGKTVINVLPRKAGINVANGLRDALKEKKLDFDNYELNGAVYVALTTPEAEARWLKGEKIFAECKNLQHDAFLNKSSSERPAFW